jgi:glycosyltransferase involved in cell wall biosynthesis
MGCLAMGQGGLSVALAMAGVPYSIPMPKVVKVWLTGRLTGWAQAKDVILHMLSRLRVKGGVGRIFEYCGPGVETLSVPERATITNMGAELGATGSLFPSDERTREFLRQMGREDDWEPLYADEGATYDEEMEVRKTLAPAPFYQEHFGNDLPNLVFIGRLTAVKKLDMIIHAISLLRDRGFLVNMTYVGDGPKKAELEGLTEQLGLQENVWFYGPCYEERQIAQIIYNADLCVSPGDVGLTAIHAMTFGTPVISHNNFCHQMPEFEAIEEGKTGSFFAENDIESMASCIQSWLTNGLDREQVRQNCYEVINSRYNPHRQVEMIRKVIYR